MRTYIVKDWAGNEMDWGIFDHEDLAFEEIDKRVYAQMEADGIFVDDEEVFAEYAGEYHVTEHEHDIY
jgi:hypothetical protein